MRISKGPECCLKAETDTLDQSALLVFFVLMSLVIEVKETEKKH